MPTSFPAPVETSIEALFAGLISASPHVTRVPATDADETAVGVLAEFVTEDDVLAVVVFSDHEAVNAVGGALSGVEAERVTEANGSGSVLDESVDGLRRALDSFATCLNTEYTKPVHLGRVHPVPSEADDDAKQLWQQPNGRRAYRVAVDDYGAGTMLVCLA